MPNEEIHSAMRERLVDDIIYMFTQNVRSEIEADPGLAHETYTSLYNLLTPYTNNLSFWRGVAERVGELDHRDHAPRRISPDTVRALMEKLYQLHLAGPQEVNSDDDG